MNVFIIHAHPEPKSLNAAMTRAASAALQQAGHAVVVSDLYARIASPARRLTSDNSRRGICRLTHLP